jgi:MFS family permease
MTILAKLRLPSPRNQIEANALYLELEVFWAAFLSAVVTFNAPFALRLGATNTQIGLLSSIPALLAILITIPAGRYYSRRAQRMPLVIRSLFAHRLGFLLAAFVPFLPVENKGTVLIWVLILFSSPAHFFGVGWNAMIAEVVPEANRARVVAVRNMLVAAVVTAGTFGAGIWLERVRFAANYQILYVAGFATSMVSLYYITKLRAPDAFVPPAPAARSSLSLTERADQARQAITSQPDFRRLVINTLSHGLGVWMIGPLYVLYFVRELGAAEGWLGTNGMVANLTPILGYYLWQRAVRRWGEKQVLKSTIVLVGVYPVLVGLSPTLSIVLIWTALNGLIVPGVTLGHYPMMLKICPADQRPLYIGIYTTIMNVGAFVMPLIGVWLADRIGIAPVLIAGGLLCILGSSSFWWRPLQTPDSLAMRTMDVAPASVS